MPGKVKYIEKLVSKDNQKQDIEQLLHQLFSWPIQDIEQESITGGFMNETMRCWNKKKPNEENIVVRLWSDKTKFITAEYRKTEAKIVEVLSENGCFPKLYAVFQNGFCCQFYQGKCLTQYLDDVEDQLLINAVTKGLAKIHTCEVPSLSKTPAILQEINRSLNVTTDDDWDKIRDIEPRYPSKNEFLHMYNRAELELKNLNSPIILNHGDCHFGNMLWNKETDQVVFVDCEFSNYNYQAYDIAYHFYSYHYDEVFGKDLCPKDEEPFRKRWIKAYLTAWFEATGRKASEITDKDIERINVQAKKLSLFVCFWIITTSVETIDVDYKGVDAIQMSLKAYNYISTNFTDFINLRVP